MFRIDPKTRRLIVSDMSPSISGILTKIANLTTDVELSLKSIKEQQEKVLVLQGLMLEHIKDASTAEPDVEELQEELKDMMPEVRD